LPRTFYVSGEAKGYREGYSGWYPKGNKLGKFLEKKQPRKFGSVLYNNSALWGSNTLEVVDIANGRETKKKRLEKEYLNLRGRKK